MNEQQRAQLEELTAAPQQFKDQWFPSIFPCIGELSQLVDALRALQNEVSSINSVSSAGGTILEAAVGVSGVVSSLLNAAERLLDERVQAVKNNAELAKIMASQKQMSSYQPPAFTPPQASTSTSSVSTLKYDRARPLIPTFASSSPSNNKLIGQGVSTMGQIMAKEGKTKGIQFLGHAVHVLGEVISRKQ